MKLRKKIKRYFKQKPHMIPALLIIVIIIIAIIIFFYPTISKYITNLGDTTSEGDTEGDTTNIYIYNDIIYDDAIFVGLNGDNSTGNNWEEAYTTLNQAISAASSNLNDKTLIFVGTGIFDIFSISALNITKNINIVGSGRDATIFTNTHSQSDYVFNATQYFMMEHCAIIYNQTWSGINIYGNNSDTHLNHMKFYDGEQHNILGIYPATYSFTYDIIGGMPNDFGIGQPGGTVQVIDELDGHDNVVEMEDTANADFLTLEQFFMSPDQENGIIEWYWRTDDAALESEIHINNDATTAFIVSIRGDDFDYYDGGWNEILSPALDDTWYHMKIVFECSTSEFEGLAQHTYFVFINGVEYGPYPFWWNENEIDHLHFQTGVPALNYYQYIDALDYSWEKPIALHLEHGGYGEYEDLHFYEKTTNSIAINVSKSQYNHFSNIEIHDYDIGINIYDNSSQNNIFEDIDIFETGDGIDIDGGLQQYFYNIKFFGCTVNVDDEVGNSEWKNINTDIELKAVQPQDLTGIVINTGGAGNVYGTDVLILDTLPYDSPYYIVSIIFEPNVKEKYGLRLWLETGYFYETIIEAINANEIITHIIKIPRVFNAHSRIYCSIKSETGGNSGSIWLEIVAI